MFNLGIFSQSSTLAGRGRNHYYVHIEDEETETEGVDEHLPQQSLDLSGFSYNPLQLWLTPLMRRVKADNYYDEADLPNFGKNSRYLRSFARPLYQGNYFALLLTSEVGWPLVISGILEFISSCCALSAPLVLHEVLSSPKTIHLAVILFLVTIFATLTGRAKDQICRVLAARLSAMLQSAIFEKSLRLSSPARMDHSVGNIISSSTNDMVFLRNYFVKVHDIWSGPFQLIVIFFLVVKIMGPSGLVGFFVMITLLASQNLANSKVQAFILSYLNLDEERITQITQTFQRIKGIKSLALEETFSRNINKIRESQLLSLWQQMRLTFCFFTSINQMTPGLVAMASFTTYWYAGNKLTAEVVFPAFAFFEMSFSPASKLSLSITRQFAVQPCLRRITSILNAEEDFTVPVPCLSPQDAVVLDRATFRYPKSKVQSEADFTLGPLNLHLPLNKLTMVVGPSGSGKSTLLAAITRQCVADANSIIQTSGSIALCSQEPWIISGTVRENILFRSTLDEKRYRRVLHDCCLEQDLLTWEGGDEMMVGDNGANLSGGQRARISLARAVYSQADIILMDDPLSAVDSRIAKCLFHGCIRKLPQTVVLITHQLSFLKHADVVLGLDNGSQREYGTPKDLLDLEHGFLRSMVSKQESINPEEKDDLDTDNTPGVDPEISLGSARKPKDEERMRGSADTRLYRFYSECAGGRSFFSIWFTWWIDDDLQLDQNWYMAGYVLLILFQTADVAYLGLFLVKGSVQASRRIHYEAMRRLLGARIEFFDNQPLGRILNRLSNDIQAIDFRLMNSADAFFVSGSSLLAATVVLMISSPYLILAFIPIFYSSYLIQELYRASARELRRLCSILDSPVLAVVSETLSAVPSLKAYKAESFFMDKHEKALDRAMASMLVRYSLETWITFRAELLSAAVLGCVALLTVCGFVSKEQAGLALGMTVTLSKYVHLFLWALINVEVEMNSIERLEQYMVHTPTERATSFEEVGLPDSVWPRNGDIEFSGVDLQYPESDRIALKNLNLKIFGGQHIGIVGRSGSGKSTIVSALTRLTEIKKGSITISGKNISDLPIQQLRRGVHILPQEPVVFSGSLRKNLDPYDQFDDASLWGVLDACGLFDFFRKQTPTTTHQDSPSSTPQTTNANSSNTDLLNFPIHADGGNLSRGQVQLICLARAMLFQPKILILDEATASIDPQTDSLIQETLQSHFPIDTTIICVAHRISSVAWMDRIVVMDSGEMVEEGDVLDLLLAGEEMDGSGEKKVGGNGGYYKDLVMQSGGRDLWEAMALVARERRFGSVGDLEKGKGKQ
ncbi:MAG: hypothetical protein M1834_007981 [Cirrosporium novae-zelandiae]|nr:MAG: hypothetical protein M1834_007981 [Cirrosporium novae-zelandiae]